MIDLKVAGRFVLLCGCESLQQDWKKILLIHTGIYTKKIMKLKLQKDGLNYKMEFVMCDYFSFEICSPVVTGFNPKTLAFSRALSCNLKFQTNNLPPKVV